MRFLHKFVRFAAAVVLLGISANQPAQGEDVLYIGDGGDNSIKAFDADSGELLGDIVKSKAGLHGPRGMVMDEDGNLLVSDQNLFTSTPGDVLLYSTTTGKLIDRVVPHSDENAPTVQRGLIRVDDVLFIADLTAEPRRQNHPPTPGRVRAYTTDGEFVGDLLPDPLVVAPDRFHPRALVIGPDGLLYVSNFPDPATGQGGDVLRFDPDSGDFIDLYISDAGGIDQLNRPEGIVFGPDGNLYMTSFPANPSDNDTIRIYQGPGGATPGAFVGEIELYEPGEPRAFAQTLLFGPDGGLFVPITGNGPDTGSVRCYDVATKTFDVFLPAGALGQPWYLTFGRTDPATLEYDE